ncbi:MAG TPA: CAP domain-containing protein [Chthoniobacterales bacterium]|nr:CAP domain-containing protein [Chthoniobacterales bacterium]
MDGLNPRHNHIWFALAFLACALNARAQVAPPPAQTLITGGAPASSDSPSAPAAQLYSIGDPTSEEQYYLELINRARANPVAESVRLATTTDANVTSAYNAFGVNLVLMQTQFATILPQPPLSMNATLVTAARAHSQNMLQNNYQGHAGPDGSLTTRLQSYTAGANGWNIGENVYAYSKSVWYGHAGFEVDWGGSALTGGMQVPPGHRQNIHSPDFREVGIGVVLGSNGGSSGVGPQLVTQDFGTVGGLPPLVTGVVYRDLNSNGFYDPGEGVGGVTVTVSNANSYAVTASAGGYSVPVPGNGNYTVSFSGGGVPASQKNVAVAGGQNVKADYVASGTVTPPTPTPTPTPTPSNPGAAKLANISTRAVVGTGANVLIGGFIVTGAQSKQVIVRAIGPSLPLAGKLLDPTLELHDATGALLGFNDNWSESANSAAIATSGVAPANPNESAILMSLAPGSYTAVLSGANQTTGTAVVEVYDLGGSANSRLANISTRALVQTGDSVLIGGLIVTGQSSADVIVRAIGPSLPVPGAMADPSLELRDASGALIGSNNDWKSNQQAAILGTGVAPTRDAESAIVISFSPGSYTAIVRDANGAAGVAVVEVYQLN